MRGSSKEISDRRLLKILRNGKIRVRTDIRRHLNVCVKVVEDAEEGPDQ